MKQTAIFEEVQIIIKKAREEIVSDSYYCVFYDKGMYFTRVIEISGQKTRTKFLKTRSFADNSYEWPGKDDIAINVDTAFIIAGALELKGNGSFTIAEFDKIKELYHNASVNKDKLFPMAEDEGND